MVCWRCPAICRDGSYIAGPAGKGAADWAMVVRRFSLHRTGAWRACTISSSGHGQLLQRARIVKALEPRGNGTLVCSWLRASPAVENILVVERRKNFEVTMVQTYGLTHINL